MRALFVLLALPLVFAEKECIGDWMSGMQDKCSMYTELSTCMAKLEYLKNSKSGELAVCQSQLIARSGELSACQSQLSAIQMPESYMGTFSRNGALVLFASTDPTGIFDEMDAIAREEFDDVDDEHPIQYRFSNSVGTFPIKNDNDLVAAYRMSARLGVVLTVELTLTTSAPTDPPTRAPTDKPTKPPTRAPTDKPTKPPTRAPTDKPTKPPTRAPTDKPTKPPTPAPIDSQTKESCQAWYDAGATEDGEYAIDVPGVGVISVQCHMSTNGGGWTVLQLRQNGDESFGRTWDEYKDGFGDSTNLWLGNEFASQLLASSAYTNAVLRIDMTASDNDGGASGYAQYDSFSIGDESTKYTLSIGSFSGDVGDYLNCPEELCTINGKNKSGAWTNNGMKFSTYDQDNDNANPFSSEGMNCSEDYRGSGGWWYNRCGMVDLNSEWGPGKSGDEMDYGKFCSWKGFPTDGVKIGLAFSRMMFR